MIRTLRLLVVGLLWFSWSGVSLAENEPPARKVPVPKRGTFYLSIMDPYPATFGLGITHFFGNYFGLSVQCAKGEVITYAVGLRVRPVAAKLTPIIGFTLSRGSSGLTTAGASGSTSSAMFAAAAEDSSASTIADIPTQVFAYFNTGVDWKWDNGMFMHFGIDWTIIPRAGTTEMKPFLQFGIAY